MAKQMLAIERQNLIHSIAINKKSVTISELVDKFQVSDQTIRRDLGVLEKKGILNVTHGGAYINYDVDYSVRQLIGLPKKEHIRDIALQYVENDDIIYIDGSSTAITFARGLKDKKITVVTNSIIISHELLQYKNINLIHIGGLVDKATSTCIGKSCIDVLSYLEFDKLFFSTASISIKNGLTNNTSAISDIHRTAIKQARVRYCLIDQSKFNRTSTNFVMDLNQLDYIILDSEPSNEWKLALEENKVELRY